MSWTPSTPDLIPDISDTLTQSSGPSSPPTFSSQVHPGDDFRSNFREHTPTEDVTPERPASGIVTPKPRDSLSKSSIPTATLSSGSLCAKCGGSLFATGGSGRFVTVPELNASGPPKTYHTECFRCVMCDGPFRETANGQAVFVRGEGGACHIEDELTSVHQRRRQRLNRQLPRAASSLRLQTQLAVLLSYHLPTLFKLHRSSVQGQAIPDHSKVHPITVAVYIHLLGTNGRHRRRRHFRRHHLDLVVRLLAPDARKRSRRWRRVSSLVLKGQGGMPLVWSAGERAQEKVSGINRNLGVGKG
ncbi:hypothetical protein J3R83DRAFT_6724 [Lanmaoa asiatica]|nr:hypothetical protein J3R83DRAFT_6724 [Lanmaoa asiatica]